MTEYGAAVGWIVILFTLFVTGILYMFETPLINTLISIGTDQLASGGCDPVTLDFITKSIKIYFPIVVIFSCLVYGWRKSSNRVY